MIKKKSQGSLAEKIAGVLSAVPAQFDPDEDHIDDTNAKLPDFDDFNNENGDDDELLSKFRKQNIDLLADVDKKYAGKKGSRKSLRDDSSEDPSESDYSESEGNENDEDISDNNGTEENEEIVDEENDQSSLEEEGSGSENDEYASEESENEGSIALSEENDKNFQHMRDTNISQQVKKGLCVRNQMNIWENLLEVRIQLQKCLVAANRMPQGNYYKEIAKETDPEMNFNKKVKETKSSIGNVLDKLLILQNLVIKKYPETKSLGKKKMEDSKDESDEEIPSDTEDELENEQSDSEEEIKSKSPKRRKLNDYEKDISDLHEKYRTYRNNTIEKWNAKTRLSITKNAGQTHSVVNHIEHVLQDKEKLRKRTQLKRSDYKILGEEKKSKNMESSEDNGDVKQVEEYNVDIFDDNDFYHQLLRELIEVKSTDITDPVQLGRQWIQLQNLRSKMKRKIDTKATKGRKIRYAVHSKLVNFMAPLDNQTFTEEAKNELFSSLFGKIQSRNVQLS